MQKGILDRKFFSRVEFQLREQKPGVSLNGDAQKFQAEIARLGKTKDEFRERVAAPERRVLRRAVREAFGLPRTPNDEATFKNLLFVAANVTQVGHNELMRGRVHRLSQYIGSTSPIEE